MPEDEETAEDLGLTEEVDIEIETTTMTTTPAVTLGSGLSNDLKSMLGDEGYQSCRKSR